MVKKEKEGGSTSEQVGFGVMVIFIGIFLMFIGAMIGNSRIDISLTQEVGDDVCQQLTNDSTAVASNEHPDEFFVEGKLVCTILSFDSTQNIIVKSNGK